MTEKPDAVELLLQQHRHIKDLIAAVENTSSTKVKQTQFEELRRFLAVHETAEELVTHPRARMVEGGNSVVDDRLQEETASKKLLASLDGMKVDDPNFEAGFAALKQAAARATRSTPPCAEHDASSWRTREPAGHRVRYL